MFLEMKICATLLILINVKTSFAQEDEVPVVKLPQGQIQGHTLRSSLGNKLYYAFQEIPYAAPPIGTLRFKEPTEPEKWKGIKNTTHNTRSCYINGYTVEIAPGVTESEDCLYLNVYTPVKPGSNSSIPVLFWIHGGGFYFGDGTFPVYGPQYLIDFDVVIVTINYRLGAFGFLTTEDDVIPGNIGLKDQHFALQWTYSNINLFGGDPKQITIVGESAGGASVGYHLISKKTAGLIAGAIRQSGTAICSFGYQPNGNYYAFEMGKALNKNFTSEKSSDLLKLLQDADAEDINEISLEVPEDKERRIGGGSLVWVPVVESEKLDGAFITGPMHNDIKEGNVNKVPVMIGYNSEEEIVFGSVDDFKEKAAKLDADDSQIVGNAYNINETNKETAGQQLKKLYTKTTFEDNLSALVKFKTDSDFSTPIIQHAELHSSLADVYLYQFSYKGMMGFLNTSIEGVDAVGHAEDVKYLWHVDGLDDFSSYSIGDRLTQRRLLKLWSNFVKHR
uniref:Carboxylic ester hydrolase n=1 Tax=Anoplophora glabripennis TaxID=217634 RepID=V5GH33_ANOGL